MGVKFNRILVLCQTYFGSLVRFCGPAFKIKNGNFWIEKWRLEKNVGEL
jgi:hypothetical protein